MKSELENERNKATELRKLAGISAIISITSLFVLPGIAFGSIGSSIGALKLAFDSENKELNNLVLYRIISIISLIISLVVVIMVVTE